MIMSPPCPGISVCSIARTEFICIFNPLYTIRAEMVQCSQEEIARDAMDRSAIKLV